MEIGFANLAIFALSSIYLLFLPGYNLLRTYGKLGELEPVERLLLSFGLSVVITGLIALILSQLGAPGLNFGSLLTAVTFFIVVSTRELLAPLKRALGGMRENKNARAELQQP